MIELLRDMPEGVAGFVAKQRVTRRDYERVVLPVMQTLFAVHGKIRCYYELGDEFSGMDGGAIWEDFKLGFEHPTRWERVAVVSDVEWLRVAINLLRFVISGEIRVFPTALSDEARAWVVEGMKPRRPAA
ncbi:hypothetical protein LMG28688_05869 [Paraburkholderia caffeinitolerans]|uniref:STAS/SEC14 domain-containing protein n=1 Tax=Paraburkholderia caffeinitolerans TaxID=1723730 RepID=A0A6J5GSH4_9BURK|nr:STAS/SEC14 domain-containing protein [Paraburkholderia caffeinitolerans]CAB3803913.1 hypothetical protein LMG28688_05869 [Paraburkholderia caffeinitolerans]